MRYYILAVTKDHVEKGKNEGFAQTGHGKRLRLKKLNKGDWIIYYSSRDKEGGRALQKFTALGQVSDHQPYQVSVREGFEPWRREVQYYPAHDIAIRPLLEQLDFISNKKYWGAYLMSGFVEINRSDFNLISGKMLNNNDSSS